MILEPLTIPGQPAMLTQLMDYVAWVAAGAGLPEQTTYRLSLAVDEIATNIVLHGYDDAGRTGNLTIWADADDERLTVYLEDTGEPFDPRQAPAPGDLDRPLEERRDGGLGIFLALWGVDDFAYERRGEVNRCVFVVNLGEKQ
jgi:anti-sigma regulatory factor (Ser/Thr protein kinase)